MAISLKHPFASGKADGTDVTLIQPSNWNAEHALTLATDKLLGRATAGTGVVEEIPCTAIARAILAAADAAAVLAALGVSAFTTGDLKPTFKTVADTGWVMMNDGSIGSAASGALSRAHADTQALYTLIYNNITDANAPVTGGRGANAAADFAANKAIALPKAYGRALGIAGAGADLTSRALGLKIGTEVHTLDTTQIPLHNHTININDPGHDHGVSGGTHGGDGGFALSGSGGTVPRTSTAIDIVPSTTGIWATSSNTGSGVAHNNMQPTAFVNMMVKL